MDRKEVEQQIAFELEKSKGRVLSQNALNALFGAFSDPVGALGKIFLGGKDAVDAEKLRLEQGYVLDLLCSMDDLLKEMQKKAAVDGIVIDGLIETTVQKAGEVVGVHITDDMKNVQFRSGTHIKTDVANAEKVTVLKLGGKG